VIVEWHPLCGGASAAAPGEAANDNATSEQDRFEAAVMRELAGGDCD